MPVSLKAERRENQISNGLFPGVTKVKTANKRRKLVNYNISAFTIALIMVTSSNSSVMAACEDNQYSTNHAVAASDGSSCDAIYDYYEGLNVAHATGEGSRVTFIHDDVILSGRIHTSTSSTSHILAVGGTTSYSPGAATIIANGNLTIYSRVATNGRGVYIHNNTSSEEDNFFQVNGDIEIYRSNGINGAGIENAGGIIEIYGSTHIETEKSDGIRSRPGSLSTYHGPVTLVGSSERDAIRITGGEIYMKDTLDITGADKANGIFVRGKLNVAGDTNINISGSSLRGGIISEVNGSSVFDSDVNINITGSPADASVLSYAGIATSGGVVTIKGDATIFTEDGFSRGIYTDGGDVSILGATSITNIGTGASGFAHGIDVGNNSNVTLSGGANIHVLATDASVINSHYAPDTPDVDTVYINEGRFRSDAGDIASVRGGNLHLILDRVLEASSGTNTLLHVGGGENDSIGNADLEIWRSDVSGDIHVDLDNFANISLYSANLTGAVNNATSFYTDPASSLALTSGSTISDTLENAGAVIFSANANQGPTNLTVGNYTGSGGSLVFRTTLGDDGSDTDMLFVQQDTSGDSEIKVINAGGDGAPTSEGIKLIDVGGSSAGTFSLVGDYVFEGDQAVVGGAYAYRLYQGATSYPDDGNWYLRSSLKPVDPVDPEDPDDPDDPGNGDPADPEAPLYQPGVPLYESYPQLLLGLNGLPTLQQRVGNRYWSGNGNRVIAQGADTIQYYAPAEEAGAYMDGNGIWGRIEGAHNRLDPKFSTSGADYSQNVFRMQAGADMLLGENTNGTLIGGVFAHYVHGKTKVRSIYGDGTVSTEGYGLGGSLTWYGNEGFYVDGQAQATWYDSDLASTLARTGLVSGNKGFGYALSLETGKRFAITPEWSLTPQAQLTYSSVDFDSFHDVWGAHVRLDKGHNLEGRLGVTLDHEASWQNDAGLTDRAHIYGLANLYYGFTNGTRVNVANTRFTQEQERLWGGLGLGGSYNWNDDKYSLYGEGLIKTSMTSFGDSYALKGNVGFRVKW